MAGANEPFEKVAYFFSDLFDLQIAIRGYPRGHSAKILGDVDTGEYVELYANEEGQVSFGIGVTRDDDRYGKITDALETIVLEKRIAREVTAADIGIE
jgi:hypothetical protein